MRRLSELNSYRRCDWEIQFYGAVGNDREGCFVIERDGVDLNCIASSGGGWDHISVSVSDRCPTWDELECVRRHFSRSDETWMQLHVPEREHVNCHPHCLHLWRPHFRAIPKPPSIFVGPH